MTLKIVATSDTHGSHEKIKLPAGDVLIHCGDFSGRGSLSEYGAFLTWLEAQPFKHKLFTFGNHDCWAEDNMSLALAMVPKGVTCLVDDFTMIDGLMFYGSPWTPEFCNWSFMSDRGAPMKAHWDKIPNETDILFTHGPPYGHGDLCPPFKGALRPHAGCIELLLAVRRVQPLAHLFGHIHGGYGATLSQDFLCTTFMNVAACDESYAPVQNPFSFSVASPGP